MSAAHGLLTDSAERLFGTLCDQAVGAAAEAGVWPEALWRAVEAAGFTEALVPEECGGSGISAAEACGALAVAGQFAAPIPLAETMLARRFLARAGLPPIAGPLTVAPVDRRDAVTLERAGAVWRLGGRVRRVPWARQAAALVLVTTHDGEAMLVALAVPAERIVAGRNLAGEPRDDVVLDGLIVAENVAPAPGGCTRDDLLAAGAALRAQQIAGAAASVLAMTLRYAGERVQFGRPIGKFQAVQHNIAMLAGETASAAAAADMAAAAFEKLDPLAIAAAKLRAGEAASRVAALAHQVHGAIGFTREFALQNATRRLWSWREEFGKEAHWAERLGRAAVAAGGDGLWAMITAAG